MKTCHLCELGNLYEVSAYALLNRIASDSTVWKPGGCLCICESCGGVQKRITSEWHEEVAEIYRRYNIYHVSGGNEQQVFTTGAALGSSRSVKLVEFLKEKAPILPAEFKHLDIGCGNGAFLKSLSAEFPGWMLFGSEVSDKYKSEVGAIPGVEAFFTQDLLEIPGKYNGVSLVHVLEHVPFPVAFLQTVKSKLTREGVLFIELPYFVENSFDLLIADHSTHFTPRVLEAVVRKAGFKVVAQSSSWVAKELTMIAVPETGAPSKDPSILGDTPESVKETVSRALEWLGQVLQIARNAPAPLGIFGTSNAASWLQGELGDKISFFVDEDLTKIGKKLSGKPIFSPLDAPMGSTVVLPLPPKIALEVKAKLKAAGVTWNLVLPPFH